MFDDDTTMISCMEYQRKYNTDSKILAMVLSLFDTDDKVNLANLCYIGYQIKLMDPGYRMIATG